MRSIIGVPWSLQGYPQNFMQRFSCLLRPLLDRVSFESRRTRFTRYCSGMPRKARYRKRGKKHTRPHFSGLL